VQKSDLQAVKQALVAAGVEIYRTRPEEIQITERVRLHIMDSGVRISITDAPAVVFTARSQRSDFPHEAPDELFAKVRGAVGQAATARGYEEKSSGTTEVTDPIDALKILDVWHEVTFTKPVGSIEDAVDEVLWALAQEKYVAG